MNGESQPAISHLPRGRAGFASKGVPLVLPKRANQVWTMDFTRDNLASVRKFRTPNLTDGFTRDENFNGKFRDECLSQNCFMSRNDARGK
jgi:hypothetical protein